MTLKYEDLVEFHKKLVGASYPELEMSKSKLDRMAAMEFGVTHRQRKNAIQFLDEFGFIREKGIGLWQVRPMNGWDDNGDTNALLETKTGEDNEPGETA